MWVEGAGVAAVVWFVGPDFLDAFAPPPLVGGLSFGWTKGYASAIEDHCSVCSGLDVGVLDGDQHYWLIHAQFTDVGDVDGAVVD
jgi:hypothetical protein